MGLATGEQALTRQLLGKLQRGDLLVADRNFLSHPLLTEVLAAGVHVLWRGQVRQRSGGRYKTHKPDESARLTPLIMIKYWMLPAPA